MIILLNITNVSESQEFMLRPIDVIQLHMNWLNSTKNYLVKIENYDQIGELEGTTRMFVDYEINLNLRNYTPTLGTKSVKTFTLPNYHETRVDRYGFFQSHGISTFNPFGDGLQDLFVHRKSAHEVMNRLEKIATQIRVVNEKSGTLALCFQYNDYFLNEYKKNIIQNWANSEYKRESELRLVNEFGEQQYWFNESTGELIDYVVLRKKEPNDQFSHSPILFSKKIFIENRNISYKENRKIIQDLFGKREGKCFNSREELLRDYYINAFIPERSYLRYLIPVGINLGIILLCLLMYLSKRCSSRNK
jgi:hypothetical protein